MQHGLLKRCLPLSALGWLLVGTPIQAQFDDVDADVQTAVPRYTVEIILFRYSSGVPVGNELFLPDPPPAEEPLYDDGSVPEFGDAAAMQNTQAEESMPLEELALPPANVELTLTPRNELLLQETYDKLEMLDAYVPLLWAGWTQDAPDQDVSPEIPLRRIGDAPPDFDGSFQLYLSRFLHLVVDLTMTERAAEVPRTTRDRTPPGAALAGAGLLTQPVHLRISEDRIMKNGDLRYFDHPKFGLLAKVTRVELDELIEEEIDAPKISAVIPGSQ